MLLRTTALLLSAGLVLAACGDDDTEVGTTGDPGVTSTAPPDTGASGDLEEAQAALDEARARWEAADITDYTFAYRPICYCPPQVLTVTVEDGVVVSVEVEVDAGMEGAMGAGEPTTVDDVFDDLQAAIDDGVFAVGAEYDEELGYPVSTWIDVDSRMADEEYGIQVEELIPAN